MPFVVQRYAVLDAVITVDQDCMTRTAFRHAEQSSNLLPSREHALAGQAHLGVHVSPHGLPLIKREALEDRLDRSRIVNVPACGQLFVQ